MISFNQFVLEARKNPELNPKVSINDSIIQHHDAASKLPGTNFKNSFVSFTQIDKLGINPGSSYETPIGIYSYPSEFIIRHAERWKQMKSAVPFAGASDYANVFSVSGNILYLNQVNASVFDDYYKKLIKIWSDVKGTSLEDANKTIDSIIDDSSTFAKFMTPAGKFWYVTKAVSKNLTISPTKWSTSSQPIAWNKLFRELGIDGCVDTGKGIIHTSEPYQAVFFSPLVIKNVKRYYNKYSPAYMTAQIQTGEMLKAVNKEKSITNKLMVDELLSMLENKEDMRFLATISRQMSHGPIMKIVLTKHINKLSEGMIVEILHNRPGALKFIKNQTESMQIAAFNANLEFSFQYASNLTEKSMIVAINNDNSADYQISKQLASKYKHNLSKNVILTLLRKEPYIIELLDTTKFDEEIQLFAVRKNGSYLRFFKNPSEKIQFAAIKNEFYYPVHPINFIKSIDIIKKAIDDNVKILEEFENDKKRLEVFDYAYEKYGIGIIIYYDNLPEDIQLKIIKNNPAAILLLKNPTSATKKLASDFGWVA